MSDTAVIQDVTDATFEHDVLEASHERPVVVDFWAEWCGPCHQLSPLIEQAATRHAGDVAVAKVDVDSSPRLAQRYAVQGIPAVKAFRDGKVVSEFVGVQPAPAVESFFAALAPTQADRLVARAEQVDGAQREPLLREALAVQPDHAPAIVALAEHLAASDRQTEALALLQRAPTDADAKRLAARLSLAASGGDIETLRAAMDAGDPATAVELGRALAVQGQYEEGLDLLIRTVRNPQVRDEARAAVLSVFEVLGPDDPLVARWRPRLAAALF